MARFRQFLERNSLGIDFGLKLAGGISTVVLLIEANTNINMMQVSMREQRDRLAKQAPLRLKDYIMLDNFQNRVIQQNATNKCKLKDSVALFLMNPAGSNVSQRPTDEQTLAYVQELFEDNNRSYTTIFNLLNGFSYRPNEFNSDQEWYRAKRLIHSLLLIMDRLEPVRHSDAVVKAEDIKDALGLDGALILHRWFNGFDKKVCEKDIDARFQLELKQTDGYRKKDTNKAGTDLDKNITLNHMMSRIRAMWPEIGKSFKDSNKEAKVTNNQPNEMIKDQPEEIIKDLPEAW